MHTAHRRRYRPTLATAAGVIGLGLIMAMPVPAPAADCRPVAALKAAEHRAGDFRRGLLWKIEAAGSAPSWLFGTFHTSDPRITHLPCPVQEALDQASSYTMEMIANGAGIVSMAEAMFFNDGRTLKGVLGDVLYRETLQAIGTRDPRQAAGFDNMKPWAVMMALNGPGEGHGGLFLDMALQMQATLQNKPVYGLETMQEQIAVFNGMSMEDQIVLLRDAVQMQHVMQQAMEELTHAYLQRDLAGLMALSEKYKPADARVHQAMMDRLLTRRNHHMAERARLRLQEGNAFIAVGALHLPGQDGLLSLLTRAGYRVSPVY